MATAADVLLWQWIPYAGCVSSVSGSIDLMYGEPIAGSKHYIPYRIHAFFERPTNSFETPDEGLQNIKESRIIVSRRIAERAKVPADKEGFHVRVGDIFQFFRRGKGFMFEVKNVEKDGWINDSDTWTQYVADVVYNSTFTPDRKLVGSV